MRVAVVGAGRMGQRRIRILRQLGISEITLYEDIEERAQAMIAQYGIRWRESAPYYPYDAVFICTPPTDHLAHLAYADSADVYGVFIEKPLALELPPKDYADQITMVGCNLRWSPAALALSRWLPTIGSIRNARVWAGYDLRTTRPDWRTCYAATTGATLDVGSHMLDLALDWLGPARLVSATVKPATSIGLPDVDGAAVLLLQHESGVTSTVSVDYTQDHYSQGAVICGERGVVGYNWTRRAAYRHDYVTGETERVTWGEDETEATYVREVRSFLGCVHDGRETPNPISRASQTLRILLEAREQWRAVPSC